MPFEPGNSGRPKGTKNKNTILRELLGDEYLLHWAQKMQAISLDDNHKDQMRALETLGKNVYPDLKAVEVTGELETGETKSVNLSSLPPELLLKLLDHLKKG